MNKVNSSFKKTSKLCLFDLKILEISEINYLIHFVKARFKLLTSNIKALSSPPPKPWGLDLPPLTFHYVSLIRYTRGEGYYGVRDFSTILSD